MQAPPHLAQQTSTSSTGPSPPDGCRLTPAICA